MHGELKLKNMVVIRRFYLAASLEAKTNETLSLRSLNLSCRELIKISCKPVECLSRSIIYKHGDDDELSLYATNLK
jgi:hypothetical protein